MTWVCPSCGRRYPDSSIGVPRGSDADGMTACAECDPWDWGTLLTRDGRIIPPGACRKYRGNKANQRVLMDTGRDAPHADELTGGR